MIIVAVTVVTVVTGYGYLPATNVNENATAMLQCTLHWPLATSRLVDCYCCYSTTQLLQ